MNDYKEEMRRTCARKGWDRAPIDVVWMLFTEEVGELASAIRMYQKYYPKKGLKKQRGVDVVAEMGDVFGYLFQLADMLHVDMDAMWHMHRQKCANKIY